MKTNTVKGSRVKELQALIGEYVKLQLKDIKMYESIPELQMVGFAPEVAGYIVDVTDNFVYLGENSTEDFDTIIDVDFFAIIQICEPKEEMPEELNFVPDGETAH